MDCKIHHLNVYKARPLQTMSEPMEQQGVHIVNPPFVNSIALHPACRYAAAALGEPLQELELARWYNYNGIFKTILQMLSHA